MNLIIRNMLSAADRAEQTRVLTDGKIKSRLKQTMSSRGIVNKGALYPGLHVPPPNGPLPFVSKATVANKGQKSQLYKSERQHSKSSSGSDKVSFTSVTGTKSKGFEHQLKWIEAEFNKNLKKKLLLTIKNFNIEKNVHSSGDECEVLLRDFDFKNNETIMQHIIIKNTTNSYEVKSRKWITTDNDNFRWEEWSTSRCFSCLRKAIELICERGDKA